LSSLPALAYRQRGVLVAVPLFISMFITWRECENVPAVWIAAGIVFGLGVAIRIWSQQYLHYRLPIDKTLTTGGPYTVVRNPIYIGNTLICLGITISSRVLWMVPISLLTCCLVYTFVVRFEEDGLSKRYGEPYLAYLREVPRWIPKFRDGAKLTWTKDYLGPSLVAEAHNLIFIIPPVLKALIQRGL